MAHALIFLVAHLLIFLCSIPVAESINNLETDRHALLSFRASITTDPLGVLSSWNSSLNTCAWSGVVCGKAHPGRVVSLELSSLQLAGELSPSLANLTLLRRLDLGYNALTGDVPHSLASISSLAVLNLSSNSFSGLIPASLFNGSSQLTVIDLSRSLFSGPIPNFHNIPQLQILSLAGNNLSGSIPPTLGNVSSVTEIKLHENNLGGSIPESLSRIQNLRILSFGSNNLSGYVPGKLYNMSSLIFLDLRENRLIGRIPSGIGYSLPNLELMSMSGNMFEGHIPASLANASNLQIIDIGNNTISGRVPLLGSLPDLYILNLGSNRLESYDWTFLASLKNCTQLERLELDGNILSGSLPRLVGNLSTSLQYLNFENNQIVGPTPFEIGKLASLIMLNLGQNQLVDTIPKAVWNLPNLQMLDMNKNLLSGVIPSAIGNLSLLAVLNLSGNKLSGQIPSTLGNLFQLLELELDNNKLSGNIPASLGNCKTLVTMNLASNSLTGSIPAQIGALINLVHLDISYNNFSGEAPSSLGQCLSLQYLNTKRNMLNGSIPPSFHHMKSISLIDLSQNNFVGQIPEFLASFPFLSQLDLSNNYFEGPIPTSGVFQNTTATNLDGNTKLCANTTTFMFEYPMCPRVSAGGTKKNVRLLLIVIPPVTIALLSLLCIMVTLLKKRAHRTPCYKDTMKKVSYGDILKATNWFSPINRISSSRTGSIYIGRFEFDTDLVAIKLFHLDEHGSLSSFLMECEVLRNTRHRNLMKAATVCSTVDLENNEFKAIIFDFMANGSLDMWVHPKLQQNSPKRCLSLGQRIRIATDVASALDYMHNQLTPPLIHCDLKPANVLLDYDMTARVGDFGSAKFLCSSHGGPESIVGMGGTIGYIAPEYGMGYKISTGCDVYSFGVLLLEMLTGKRPTDAMFANGLSLHELVSSAFPHRLYEVLDPHMPEEEHNACATQSVKNYLTPLFEVALLCSMESPKDRPGIHDVCAKIFAIKEAFLEFR
ncbi:hypothetical protein ACP70R_009381 [Stipagrostis hirtigluma subsp. patula]